MHYQNRVLDEHQGTLADFELEAPVRSQRLPVYQHGLPYVLLPTAALVASGFVESPPRTSCLYPQSTFRLLASRRPWSISGLCFGRPSLSPSVVP